MISNLSIPQTLTQLIQKVQNNNNFTSVLESFKDKYNIQGTNVNLLTTQKVLQTYSTIKKKFYYDRKSPANCSWFQNELRIYIWVLICYLFVNKKEIQQMTLDDWSFFKPIFYNRDPIIFQFQGILLLKLKTSKWQQDQIKLLDKIVKQESFLKNRIKTLKNKWNSIARELYIVSEKRFIKTPKQCRQRWLNYLDPSKVHCPWTYQQDLILLTSIRDIGKRWAYTVKKLLKKRTQHMVKNRFNSLINNQKKKIGNKSESELLERAIQTARLSILQENKIIAEQSEKLQKFDSQQFQEEESQSLFVVKKKAPAKKKSNKKPKQKKSKQKMVQLSTLPCIPTQTNIEKKEEIPAEINKRKFSLQHEPFEFLEQNVSLIGFNPFEEFMPNNQLMAPHLFFYNDHSSENLHNHKGIDNEQKIMMEIEKNYKFY